MLVPDDAPEPPITTYDWSVVEDAPPTTTILRGPDNPSMTSDPEGGGAIATFILESNDPHAIFECKLDGEAWARVPRPGRVHRASRRATTTSAPAPSTSSSTSDRRSAGRGRSCSTRCCRSPRSPTSSPRRSRARPRRSSPSTPASPSRASTARSTTSRGSSASRRTRSPSSRPASTRSGSAPSTSRSTSGRPRPGRSRWASTPIPPETTLDQTQAPGFGVANHVTPDDWATFAFTSNEDVAYFECMVDIEGELVWEECFSPTQYVEILPGQHTFQVRAVDTSFNTDPTPETWTWTYFPNNGRRRTRRSSPARRRSPPRPTPGSSSRRTGPEIEFECALDAEPFGGCESPELFTDLTPGPAHLLRARDRPVPERRAGAGGLDVDRCRSAARAARDRAGAARDLRGPALHLHVLRAAGRPERDLRVPPDAGLVVPRLRAVHLAALLRRPGRGRVHLRGPRRQRVRHRGRDPGRVRVRGRHRSPTRRSSHGPSGQTSSNTAAFAFASNEQGSTFIC